MNEALISLGQAFQAEAARQERERVIEHARAVALLEREATLHAYPVSWPVTMMQEMQVYYGDIQDGSGQ